jgi:hypothetical protein
MPAIEAVPANDNGQEAAALAAYHSDRLRQMPQFFILNRVAHRKIAQKTRMARILPADCVPVYEHRLPAKFLDNSQDRFA